MSNTPQDRSGPERSDLVGKPAPDVTPGLILAGVAVGGAAAVAALFLNRMELGHVATIFLAAVLLVAVMFGLTYGLLAAVAALAAYNLLLGLPVTHLDLQSQDTLLLFLFGVGIAITGRYTDIVRQRNRRARSLLEAGRSLSHHVSGRALDQFLKRARPAGDDAIHGGVSEEAQRAIVSFCMVGAGLLAGLLTREMLGPTAAVVCILSSVVVVARFLGARFGFAAGIFAALVMNRVLMETTVQHPPEVIFVVLAFSAIGWGVGTLADAFGHERHALETLVSAGRNLSSSNDEGAIRQVLVDSLVRLAPRARVSVRGDTEGPVLAAGPSAGQAWSDTDPRWRTRPLIADGREVGLARWRFPGPDKDTRSADETASALIDLGASAIVRTRLNVEKGDMEFVARTEHLRTILLDAVSHHFRSPLAGILGSVTGILNLPDNHDRAVRRELLLIIKEQANRLSRYVDNFLSVARLESGSIDVKPVEVTLESLIYDVWETFGEAGGARRFLQASIDPAPIRTDPALLGQVLGNVLENAIKYSPEGSVVDVRSWREPGRLVLQVKDQGPGVPPQSQARIFERFYRSQAAHAPGLGLGLYITRSLIEMLGGSVEAHNRTGVDTGLIVSITLPLAETST